VRKQACAAILRQQASWRFAPGTHSKVNFLNQASSFCTEKSFFGVRKQACAAILRQQASFLALRARHALQSQFSQSGIIIAAKLQMRLPYSTIDRE
jgi:hypothetical protein